MLSILINSSIGGSDRADDQDTNFYVSASRGSPESCSGIALCARAAHGEPGRSIVKGGSGACLGARRGARRDPTGCRPSGRERATRSVVLDPPHARVDEVAGQLVRDASTEFAPVSDTSSGLPNERKRMPFLKGSSGRSPRSGRRMRRVAKILGIVALALVALVLVSASINRILTKQEKSRFAPYGQRVSVDGGSLNVWRNGHAGPTMVLLSGLGTAAPALDFAPLIRQLGAYNVFVVEGFGYGYSDMSARPRTVQNITTELHDVLAKLRAPKPYILVGHSIAGFYTLSYAHRYPEEVSAVVGIDPTVPASKAGPAGTSGLPFHALGAALRMSGSRPRRLSRSPPASPSPKGTPTRPTSGRASAPWRSGTSATRRSPMRPIGWAATPAALRGVTYPDRLPVLDFLSSDSVATLPRLGRVSTRTSCATSGVTKSSCSTAGTTCTGPSPRRWPRRSPPSSTPISRAPRDVRST